MGATLKYFIQAEDKSKAAATSAVSNIKSIGTTSQATFQQQSRDLQATKAHVDNYATSMSKSASSNVLVEKSALNVKQSLGQMATQFLGIGAVIAMVTQGIQKLKDSNDPMAATVKDAEAAFTKLQITLAKIAVGAFGQLITVGINLVNTVLSPIVGLIDLLTSKNGIFGKSVDAATERLKEQAKTFADLKSAAERHLALVDEITTVNTVSGKSDTENLTFLRKQLQDLNTQIAKQQATLKGGKGSLPAGVPTEEDAKRRQRWDEYKRAENLLITLSTQREGIEKRIEEIQKRQNELREKELERLRKISEEWEKQWKASTEAFTKEQQINIQKYQGQGTAPDNSDLTKEGAQGKPQAPGTNPLDAVFGYLIQNVENLAKVLDPITTMLGGFMEVIAGPLNDALQPLVDLLTEVGKVLGELLLPVVKILGVVIKGVAVFIASIFNAIASVINFLLGWLGVKIKLIDIGSLGSGGGDQDTSGKGGGGGSSGNHYSAAPIYNVTINIYTAFLNAGDQIMNVRDISKVIRREIEGMEAIGV